VFDDNSDLESPGWHGSPKDTLKTTTEELDQPLKQQEMLKRVKFTFDMHCSIWGNYCMVPVRVSSFDQGCKRYVPRSRSLCRSSRSVLFPSPLLVLESLVYSAES
jgi:hypothetical protein